MIRDVDVTLQDVIWKMQVHEGTQIATGRDRVRKVKRKKKRKETSREMTHEYFIGLLSIAAETIDWVKYS